MCIPQKKFFCFLIHFLNKGFHTSRMIHSKSDGRIITGRTSDQLGASAALLLNALKALADIDDAALIGNILFYQHLSSCLHAEDGSGIG